jgi:hypothetical protein
MIRGDRNLAAALVGAALMFCAATPQAKAQAVAVAEVDGHVTDPSGQFIAGATVKMTQTAKNQVRTATTDSTGRFQMPNLAIGPYRLEVTAPGFKEYVQTGIELQIASNVEVPVVMTIGAVTESVAVTANAAMVETKDSSIGQVIGTRSIEDLPLNGRNPTQLLTLTGAGTSTMTLNGGDLTGSKNMGGSNASGQFAVAGGQANGVNYLLDGGDNNDNFSNVNLPIPFPDAIQEFNVQTSGLPAQYGLHPGGVVNIVTKGGANALHGDAFFFLRNGDLNARQKGDQYGTQPVRDTIKRSQFGGTAGGRIIKDKLFFFGGYQGTRQRSDPTNNTAYTPTAATLKGDFSVIDAAKANGGCLASAKTLLDPAKTPYPGNQIPVSSFDAAGFKLASSFLPVASDPCGKVLYGNPANNPDDQWIGRIDWVVSDRHNFYGRYYIYDYTAQAVFDGHNALTTSANGNQQRSQTITIGDNYTLGGGQDVNSFHATANRRRNNRSAATNLFSPKDLGVNMFINIPNYTQLSVSGYSGGGFNVGCGTCALSNFNDNTYQVADDFTMIRGRHQFQFGFDGRKVQFNSFNYQQANGQFTFNGTYSGDGLADLLTGRIQNLTDGNVISDYIRNTAVAAYAQDAIHLAKGLSVNIGIRWEPAESAYDKQGRGNQFSWPLFAQGWHSAAYNGKAPAGLVFTTDTAQDPYGKALTANHWALFSPRLGIVWDPKGDGKQTIRGAFVLIHDTAQMFYPERWTTNAPYVSSLSLNYGQYCATCGLFSNPFGGYPGGDPFPGNAVFPNAGVYISVPPNVQPQHMMQWNLSYQRQFGNDWLVTANYMGNATRHIWGSTDVNYAVSTVPGANSSNTNARRLTVLANPTLGAAYSDIQQTDDGGNGEYHGMLLSAQKRVSHGINLNINYNWSHCSSSWDYAGELAGVLYQNPTNRKTGERGACGFDHRQNFVATLVATSPGVGEHVVKTITKDWQLSPLVNLFTGQPVQLSDGGKDISLSGQGLDRPEVLIPNAVYGSPKTLGGYLNQSAFGCYGNVPQNVAGSCTVFSGQYGNLGRNAIYAPGTITWDMALSRRFKFNERLSMDFRSDFFNIMNHANWNGPSNSLTASTFGQITGFGSPRIIQFSTKFFF